MVELSGFGYLLLALALAFIITHVTIPAVIRVAREKHLLDEPNNRSSHAQKTPSLGGIAIFASLTIVFLLVAHLYPSNSDTFYLILPPLVILFFIGLKDDILVIDPHKKIAAQLIAAGLVITCADIRIGSLFGLFGLYELPYIISLAISLFIFVVVVNAYNLIDGIDGLAASLGIVAALAFGTYFYWVDAGWAVVLSATLIGSLISFLFFNFSKENKIFMGDSGSLIVGFVIAVLTVAFIQSNEVAHAHHVPNAPTVAILVLAIPLFDALRVFSQRILSGYAPFRADRNHIHHFMIDGGFTHGRTSLLLTGLSLAIAVGGFLLLTQASVGESFAELMVIFLLYSFLLRRNSLLIRRSKILVRRPSHAVRSVQRQPAAVKTEVPVEID